MISRSWLLCVSLLGCTRADAPSASKPSTGDKPSAGAASETPAPSKKATTSANPGVAAKQLVRVDEKLTRGTTSTPYAIELPAGFKAKADSKAGDVRWSLNPDDADVTPHVNVALGPMPEDLEEAVMKSVLFPEDCLITRKEALRGGGFIVAYHDKDGSRASVDVWKPSSDGAAIMCGGSRSQESVSPEQRAELERICLSLTPR